MTNNMGAQPDGKLGMCEIFVSILGFLWFGFGSKLYNQLLLE